MCVCMHLCIYLCIYDRILIYIIIYNHIHSFILPYHITHYYSYTCPLGCRRVSSTVLLDPVSFLLCDPKVATTVVYKDPINTLDFLMHFFVASELFIGQLYAVYTIYLNIVYSMYMYCHTMHIQH